MKVIELLQKASNPFISVEIIPPRRGSKLQNIYQAIESILPFEPKFIDITSHAAEVIWEEMPDGTYIKRTKRKSPGTFGLCAVIKYKFNIEPVPHILCNGFTREETEDALIELNFLGVENLLLIRGDGQRKPNTQGRTTNLYALDLVKQVADMNRGKYLDDLIDAAATNFCIGVACYPEKHFESPNLKFDIQNLKNKYEAGADYAVCQMFFNNQYYYDYLNLARTNDIHLPIIPGLKILTSKKQINSIPKAFFVDLPEELIDAVQNAKDDNEVTDIGIEWAYQQSLDLLDKGCTNLHFYIMQNTEPFIRLMNKLKKHI